MNTTKYIELIAHKHRLIKIAVRQIIRCWHFGKLNVTNQQCTIQDFKAFFLCAKDCYNNPEIFKKIQNLFYILHRLPIKNKKKVISTINSSTGESIEILVGYTI